MLVAASILIEMLVLIITTAIKVIDTVLKLITIQTIHPTPTHIHILISKTQVQIQIQAFTITALKKFSSQ